MTTSAPRSFRARAGLLLRHTADVIGRHDLMLLAAGVTFYAAVAIMPLLFVTVWLLRLLVGADRVTSLARSLFAVLPDQTGAVQVAAAVVDIGGSLSPLAAAACVLPATLYGEGLRRAYTQLAELPDESRVGLRGRLAVVPLLVVAPVLLLAVLGITPVLNRLLGEGPGQLALGVYLALTVNWLVLAVPLGWSYRIVAPDPPSWPVALVGALVTAAFLSGFLQGFVLFLSLPLDLGAPFAGATAVGASIAVLGWLWVLHLVVLVGYAGTRQYPTLPPRVRVGQIPVVARG